jgi:hypothetical protein
MPEVARELFIFGALRIKSLMQWMGTAKLYPLEAVEEQRNRDKNVPGGKVMFVAAKPLAWSLFAIWSVSDIFESLDLNG